MAARLGEEPIGLLLADAGYLSVDNLTAAGPDRLIAVGNVHAIWSRPPDTTPSAANRQSVIQRFRRCGTG